MVIGRRNVILLLMLFMISVPVFAAALDIVSSYSPHNSERPKRKSTDFIILHTTEGASKGSLNKVRENGEAHYFIDPAGRVYRIIDKQRIAFHAGRSMWSGRTDLDNYSIGIEVAGFHNKDITSAQYKALKEVVSELKKIYKVSDDRILTHSMIAYGAPNRWQKYSHRGRKRCGMLFARTSVRSRLGIASKPLYDPDVRARRLVDADPYLAKVLYGNTSEQETAIKHLEDGESNVISANRSAWDIARDKYRSSDTLYIFPGGTKYKGSEIKDWGKVPVGTKVVFSEPQSENEFEGVKIIGEDGDSAREIAGDEYNGSSTIYILPGGNIKGGDEFKDSDWSKLPAGTRILVGYTRGGTISAKRMAYDICGKRWNFPSTYYMLPDGSIRAGNMIKESSMSIGTHIFYRR